MLKRILSAGILIFPIAAWAIYKPVRVIAPGLVPGIRCENAVICSDNVSRFPQARELYDEAVQFVEASIGELKKKPRIIFCESQTCFKHFGFNTASAQAVGTSGIVIGPRGWKDYYVRHEIIHHLQAERMGIIKHWLSPAWFKEGMAYYLSEDPRKVLSDRHQKYREQYAQWHKSIDTENLWKEASKL